MTCGHAHMLTHAGGLGVLKQEPCSVLICTRAGRKVGLAKERSLEHDIQSWDSLSTFMTATPGIMRDLDWECGSPYIPWELHTHQRRLYKHLWELLQWGMKACCQR